MICDSLTCPTFLAKPEHCMATTRGRIHGSAPQGTTLFFFYIAIQWEDQKFLIFCIKYILQKISCGPKPIVPKYDASPLSRLEDKSEKVYFEKTKPIVNAKQYVGTVNLQLNFKPFQKF